MQDTDASRFTHSISELLDRLAEAAHADEALHQVDVHRLRIAPGSIFSIQQNVTTAQHPAGEIHLRRFFSSEDDRFPVHGTKQKTLTPWTECLFVHGRVFVGEGEEALAQNFDDHEEMRSLGLQSVINVPMLRGDLCFATLNVFGSRPRWEPEEILGIRVLALAASRWVPIAPGLAYRLSGVPITASMEA